MQTQLEKSVWRWMDNDLSIPRPELNGHPLCPWINKYRDRIIVKEIEQGVKMPMHHCASMLTPLKLMAVVLAFPRKPPVGTIKRAMEEILNDDEFEHIEMLYSNHRLRGTYRGVYSGFRQCDLVIIQDRERLKWARIASKKAGYYNTR